jgi:methyltransferase (TIGR00027 family)
MGAEHSEAPESTAVRVSLWRAMHVLVDSPPHVLDDEVGLRLVAPGDGWRDRPDMDPRWTGPFRAAIVARARFIEDLVSDRAEHDVTQYVILGAGLDTFAQRRPDTASRLQVFEIDRPGPQGWKRKRLTELGYGIPDWLKLVPVDFETDEDWWENLVAAGFDTRQPAVVVSTGVSMYLTKEATAGTLRAVARLGKGSTLAMSFMLPSDLIDEADRPGLQAAARGAQASGTPFISYYTPPEIVAMATQAGLRNAAHIASAVLAQRYFADRPDGLRPSSGEDLLVATT